MKFLSATKTLINIAFQYVIRTVKEYDIDESHALGHSMNVYNFANRIYNHECVFQPQLKTKYDVIMTSAILHDMCDKKYLYNEEHGANDIEQYIKPHMDETDAFYMKKIILTMSYSTVKLRGYPTDMGAYLLAYHIVREADLLSAYDVERTIIYKMIKENRNYTEAVAHTIAFFTNRVLLYRKENLFITNYSKLLSYKLHQQCALKIALLQNAGFN